jgi:hypothetical protein
MPLPAFAIGPSLTVLGWARDRHQSRRKVTLTVHRAFTLDPFRTTRTILGANPIDDNPIENYYIGVTNGSRERDIVVTHIWLDTTPRVDVIDPDLPVRLRYSARWETALPVDRVPPGTVDVEWLARCIVTPDDKVIKSRPRLNVPPIGTVPRG